MRNLLARLKLTYSIFNFFHRSQLIHNEALYKKFGLNKKYYSPISSKDFLNLSDTNQHGLKQELWKSFKTSGTFNSLSVLNQNSVNEFNENGFSILEGFFTPEQIDKINAEIDLLLNDQKVNFRYRNKIMFAIHHSNYLRGIGEDGRLNEILSALLGRESVLFQSINFLTGSEQATHSDSIHMTTYPFGGLIAVWIALEDVSEDNGPLHYYPGSHKLPYYLNSDYDNEGNYWLIGKHSYSEYEKMMQKKIKEHNIKKKTFLAKKGDILIWHANLFHGGEPHTDKSKTRKSMVLHYFSKGVICYHEITQRPALLKNK